MAGYTPVKSTEADHGAIDLFLGAIHDVVQGAYMRLRGDQEISPVDNIPARLKVGWNFAQWYAFSSHSNETDSNDFIKVPRVTSLAQAQGQAWGQPQHVQLLTRCSAIVRAAAQAQGGRILRARNFLKGEGYFLEKFCGKRPQGGLYTEDELATLVKHYDAKREHVQARYRAMGGVFPDARPGLTRLGAWLQGFTVVKPDAVRLIEGYEQRRIPQLLVQEGRGSRATRTIARGGNLHEKLVNAIGGTSVRSIAIVSFSPLYGCDQQLFVTATLAAVRNRFRNPAQLVDGINSLIPELRDRALPNGLRVQEVIQAAYTTYLEVIPDKLADPSWKAALGLPDRL
jgi:hypothetical protein